MDSWLLDRLDGVGSVAISGHTRPDGDCIGACIALYDYLLAYYPRMKVDVYLEPIAECYNVLNNVSAIRHTFEPKPPYDLFISLDSSDKERLAGAAVYFDQARHTLCIDHHISNQGFADENYIRPKLSSACEVLCGLLEPEKIDQCMAKALYVGIICDTGCFKHSNTSPETMAVAGKLIATGIDFSNLMDQVFYQKTFMQNQLLGRCLINSYQLFSGRCIVSIADEEMMSIFMASSSDLEGVIDQLRVTKGAEVAVLATEIGAGQYKISLRSNSFVDVNKVAVTFGGGGHVKAAGCTICGDDPEHVINMLMDKLGEQLGNEGADGL